MVRHHGQGTDVPSYVELYDGSQSGIHLRSSDSAYIRWELERQAGAARSPHKTFRSIDVLYNTSFKRTMSYKVFKAHLDVHEHTPSLD